MRGAGDGPGIAIDHRPALDVGLDRLLGEVDQSQPGHVHSAIGERRNGHLADALRQNPLITSTIFPSARGATNYQCCFSYVFTGCKFHYEIFNSTDIVMLLIFVIGVNIVLLKIAVT